MAGATCCQLATRAVSLMWMDDVKPNPPCARDVNTFLLSSVVRMVLVHWASSLTVMVSSSVAVASWRPMARAVKVASPAVAVRHNAWATWVVRPWVCRWCSLVAVRVRLVMSRWCSGACSRRKGAGVAGASGTTGVGSAVVLSTIGLSVRLTVWCVSLGGAAAGLTQHSVFVSLSQRPIACRCAVTVSRANLTLLWWVTMLMSSM